MPLKLHLYVAWNASHSLEGNETPHEHRWEAEFTFEGTPVEGKLVDIPLARTEVEKILHPLRGTYLNECEFVDQWVRSTPTCEALAHYLYRRVSERVLTTLRARYPDVRLASVWVGLADPGSPQVMGGATYAE